jgi:hypothetical protein
VLVFAVGERVDVQVALAAVAEQMRREAVALADFLEAAMNWGSFQGGTAQSSIQRVGL